VGVLACAGVRAVAGSWGFPETTGRWAVDGLLPSWKRLLGGAGSGRVESSVAVRAVLGRGGCSGSADFRFTPAAALLGASLSRSPFCWGRGTEDGC
jgi:hypothetical protein